MCDVPCEQPARPLPANTATATIAHIPRHPDITPSPSRPALAATRDVHGQTTLVVTAARRAALLCADLLCADQGHARTRGQRGTEVTDNPFASQTATNTGDFDKTLNTDYGAIKVDFGSLHE